MPIKLDILTLGTLWIDFFFKWPIQELQEPSEMKHLQHFEAYPYNKDYTDTIFWYKLVYIRAIGVPAILTASLESLNNLTFWLLLPLQLWEEASYWIQTQNFFAVTVLNMYHWAAQKKITNKIIFCLF